MMPWMEPKTDWTSFDYYNYGDLNRIENNTAEVAAFLESIQYQVPELTVVTNRDKKSIDFISSINRVENNIEQLKDAFIAPPGYQGKETWTVKKGFSYKDANRLENNLKLIYEWAHRVKENYRYCGTFYCGEDGDIY